MLIPTKKSELIRKAQEEVSEIERQYADGLITNGERYNKVIDIWAHVGEQVANEMMKELGASTGTGERRGFNPIFMMADSGARGSTQQIRQLGGMRGLVAQPSGVIIETPITANFREGLTVLQYFISTHGARKGLADTALKTANSGYLTRRLVDISQDVIVSEDDCGTQDGIYVTALLEGGEIIQQLGERILGRIAAEDVRDPVTGELIVGANEQITEEKAATIVEAGLDRVKIRSVLTCESRRGVCVTCYGRDLARGKRVERGEPVGVIAAQSIGEHGTQLTMRTFHIGGTASKVVEQTTLESKHAGTIHYVSYDSKKNADIPNPAIAVRNKDGDWVVMSRNAKIAVHDESGREREKYPVVYGAKIKVKDGGKVAVGQRLVEWDPYSLLILTEVGGRVAFGGYVKGMRKIVVRNDMGDTKEYLIPKGKHINVQEGDWVKAGEPLMDGSANPHDILDIKGPKELQKYLVDEVQEVYRLQGVTINDKHIEIIVRQMLRKVRVEDPGDTDFLAGSQVDKFVFAEENEKVGAKGGKPAVAKPVLLGITRSALTTESLISAASFQETTRVLTEAAINGKIDHLLGLKENVIVGRLIPAGTGLADYRDTFVLDQEEKETPPPLAEPEASSSTALVGEAGT